MVLLPRLKFCQRCEPIILKMQVKSKFVLWQQLRYYNLLNHVFEVFVFFENVLLVSISKTSLQTKSLGDILSGNFRFSNSIILVEDLIRDFEIFLIDHYAGEISLVSINKFLY